MDYSKKENIDYHCQELISNCTNCGLCISECKLLQKMGEDVTNIALRQPTVIEAYSCSLCGLCEGVCPLSLSPKSMFTAIRKKAVAEGDIDIEDYRYMFPDRPLNVMKLYRELNGTDYKDLNLDSHSEVAFFPGCTMLTYDPPLIYNLFRSLKEKYQEISLMTDCCGLPLFQLGLHNRGERFTQDLKEKIFGLGVKTIIFACPNCYYQLQSTLKDCNLTFLTIYEALEDSELLKKPIEEKESKIVTIHDSCPDRFDGVFASQVRKALQLKGYSLVEMEHNHETALCCGSGGQVSHSDPYLAQNLVQSRLKEVEASKAQICTAYCLGCVLNLSKNQDSIPVQHALNLLLEFNQDFAGLKKKTQAMFEGPEGEKLWNKVMAE